MTINHGKWHLDALLGVGGMASVYAATHRNGSRKALKILHTEFAHDESIRERFIRESYVANRIEHRGRVAIDDEDVTELGEPFLVMELLDGETAQQLWKRKGRRVAPVEALWIAAEVLDTLQKFHEQGIVHRDLKPANIFITTEGVVKILDFGVARMRDATGDKTRAGTALGTPSFMAPEQAMGLVDAIDGRADLFSVGATLYALIGGQRLHEGRTDNEAFILAATVPAPSLASIAPDQPVEVIGLVDKALAWDRRNRFESAAAMRAEVLLLIDKLGGALPKHGDEPLSRRIAERMRRTEPIAPSPASVSSSRPRAPNARTSAPTSQSGRRDSWLPPARPRDVDAQKGFSPEVMRDARIDEEAPQAATRELSRDGQAELSEAKRPLVEEEDMASSDPFNAKKRRPSTERSPVNAPTAEGTLARTPFVHLLIYMLDQRLTGTTVFQAPNGVTHSIYFEDGAAAKIRTGVMVAPLDRILLEQGLLDEATLRGTLMEVSKQDILHGRYLEMRGLLDHETVIAALRVQLLRKVTHLFELPPETRYAYYEGENLLVSYGGPELTPCEPLAVIMAGIRVRASDPLVDATLLRIASRPLALNIDAELRRFHLQRDERSVVDLIRARRMTLDELLGAGVAQERVVRLTIYALALTRHLDLGSGRMPVGIHREWPGIGVLDLSQGVGREAGAAVAPQARVASASATSAAPQGDAQPHATRMPTSSQSDSGPPAMRHPPSEASAQRQTTRMPQADPGGRQTTRMPRATASRLEAEARAPSAATSEQVPRTPGWRSSPSKTLPGGARLDVETSPPSRPTTKLPRVAIPPEAYDTADDAIPPSYSASAVVSRSGPPSSQGAPRSAQFAAALAEPTVPPSRASSPASIPAAVPPPSPSSTAAIPAPSSSPPPARPSSVEASPQRPDLAARRAEIARRSKSIDNEDYFQMLGVARDATPEQIRSAYFALARTFHPDRLPGDLADMKAPLGRIFARFNDAYQTLSDAAKRKEYLGLLQQGGGTADDEAKLTRVVDAAVEFQKAEILIKKNDLAGAEALAVRAAEADPEQPEYVTLLAWVRALRRADPPGMQEGATSAHLDDLIQILDKVLAQEPRYERALYYRGVLQKRAGRAEKSIRDFKLVADINPRNIEAVREVRLHEMRRRTSPSSSSDDDGGLLGKLFKR